MAAAGNLNLSRDEVLAQDIYSTETAVSFKERAKLVISDLTHSKNAHDVNLFVNIGVKQLDSLHSLIFGNAEHGSDSDTQKRCIVEIISRPIYPASILKNEAKLWLEGIRRRLGGRQSIRHPYYGEISRDIPQEFFTILGNIVDKVDGFVEPLCFHSNNNKAEVISFTNVRLVNELFVLLTECPSTSVAKRKLAGHRKGHSVAVIVSEVKDFAFVYKKKCGKLVIGFNYGEWNVSGFPQHI